MRKILFLSKGEHSPSTRYRAFSYFLELKANGWDPSHLGFSEGRNAKLKILRAAQKADVVVILRHGLSFPFFTLLQKCSRKLVFDFDDAIFLKSNGEPSSMRSRRFERTVSKCDAVWAGNHYLADRARTCNPAVIVLPTSVDLERYQEKICKDNDKIDLVWIGSSSTRKYLEDVLPAIERAAEDLPQLRLRIIADFSLQSETLEIVEVPWSQDLETRELMNAHIGIAPLYDDPWTRGKCALKVLQYMASNLPVISSRAGANAEIVKHSETGFLVDSEQAWVDAIHSLAESVELREQMGNAGRFCCEENYSLVACKEIMLSQLDKLID